MVHGPALLLLDEPFTGLDGEGRAWLRAALLAHRSRGGGAVVTTHRADEVDGVCDSFAHLEGGRLVSETVAAHPDPAAPRQHREA
jgi:ABC-type multidrug transport system ATPase subunit